MLDKYEVLQKIGEGGMATVYRGRHLTLGRDVAIKVLHSHLGSSERNRSRFAREARAIEHLDHENVLEIFDYSGTDTESCYIVTEFVDGLTLHKLQQEHGRLPSEVVSLIGLQLVEALRYAHSLGIIHRDLKPENVMLRRDGVVKLMDFGIARFLDEVNVTITGALVGSPAYMSPEQARNVDLDAQSDLFSLGTLLFHLVTGRLPFAGANPSIILRNIIEGNRPGVMELAPGISGSLAQIIEHLLEVEPTDRPANISVVSDSLRRTLSEIDIDTDDSAWGLIAWLFDPAGYNSRLDERLATFLLSEGKARLAQKDHLGALQLFNRLLSFNEDNEEVLTLVQGMHTGGRLQSGVFRKRWWAGGLGVVILVASVTWILWPRPPQPKPEVAQAPAPLPALESTDASSLDPEPLPESIATEPVEDDSVDKAGPSLTPVLNTDKPIAVRPPTDEIRVTTELISKTKVARRGGKTAATVETETAKSPSEASGDNTAASPGLVRVLVNKSWGHIFIDGVYRGRTGNPNAIPVMPGKHVLRVENDLALPHLNTFNVEAGQSMVIDVGSLQPKPITARFTTEVGGDCAVVLDGRYEGTVDSLERRLQIEDPTGSHTLILRCKNGNHQMHFQNKTPGSVVQVPD